MTGWVVRCPEFTTRPQKTREGAERLLALIERGGHCSGAHEVLSVVALQRKESPMTRP